VPRLEWFAMLSNLIIFWQDFYMEIMGHCLDFCSVRMFKMLDKFKTVCKDYPEEWESNHANYSKTGWWVQQILQFSDGLAESEVYCMMWIFHLKHKYMRRNETVKFQQNVVLVPFSILIAQYKMPYLDIYLSYIFDCKMQTNYLARTDVNSLKFRFVFV